MTKLTDFWNKIGEIILGNSISDGLGFRAALGQFGAAGSQLAQAFVKAPFTGGWERLILVGPPVLLITSGVGALIFTVMHRILLGISKAIYTEGKNLHKNFFKSRTVSLIPPPRADRRIDDCRLLSQFQKLLGDVPKVPPATGAAPPSAPVVLTLDNARERNQSLLKFLALIERQVIDPIVAKSEPLSDRLCSQAGLKSWLMDMTLWRLGIIWDQLEEQYVKMQTSTASPDESRALRSRFAVLMNDGMAGTLHHVLGAVYGWVKVFKNPRDAAVAAGPAIPVPVPDHSPDTNISLLVQNVSTTVQGNLTHRYLVPLWQKKHKEWREGIETDLKTAMPNTDITFFQRFMNGEESGRAFLENVQSFSLPTSLVSRIFFARAVRSMGSDLDHFGCSTETILKSVLGQVQPTVVDTLTRAFDAVAQLSFRSAVPKVVQYCIELLKCCTTMQTIRTQAETASDAALLASATGPGGQLQAALAGAGVVDGDATTIVRLYDGIAPQISGERLIRSLPEASVHQVVRASLDSTDAETNWIETKMLQLKHLLRARARKYAQDEGTWLFNLLKSRSGGASTDLMSLVQSGVTKLTKIPGLEEVMKFSASGLQSFIEGKVCGATQVSLNAFTSTGYLSTLIATFVVSGLIAKEETKWNRNLPILQLAYQFLQPEEKAQVLKHLGVMCENSEAVVRRRAQLEDASAISATQLAEIEAMQKLENDYKAAQDRLALATQDVVKGGQAEHIRVLMAAHEKLKRAKELKQFERVRTLVTCVAADYLKDVVTVQAARDVCIRILHETLTLLTCQEIIKHWIFTIVDLVIDELKDTTDAKPVVRDLAAAAGPDSLLDFIDDSQRASLLQSLGEFLGAVETDRSWLSIKSWGVSITRAATGWTPDYLWSRVIEPYREIFKITPVQLKEKLITVVGDFGTKESGLSDLIVQGLTANVADPRA